MFFETGLSRHSAARTLFTAICIAGAVLSTETSAQTSTCASQCGATHQSCQAQKPFIQEPHFKEPKATRARRMEECEDDKLRCERACRMGEATPPMVKGVPPDSCLAISPVENIVGTDSCGHGLHELWVVVKNSRKPGCPARTQFTFKELENPLESDAKENTRGPYTAPFSIQTCGKKAWDFKPTSQQMPQ